MCLMNPTKTRQGIGAMQQQQHQPLPQSLAKHSLMLPGYNN
jgi:hypothetical protein